MEFASHSDLLEENARLHGKVKSLEYEVEMLTQLVKNLIYAGTPVASGPRDPFSNSSTARDEANKYFDDDQYQWGQQEQSYGEDEPTEDQEGFEPGEELFHRGALFEEDNVERICRKQKDEEYVDEVPKVENRAEMIEEMCHLYGEEKSGEILSFEMSMQARFNLNCDTGAGAKHWPCMPLKIKHQN